MGVCKSVVSQLSFYVRNSVENIQERMDEIMKPTLYLPKRIQVGVKTFCFRCPVRINSCLRINGGALKLHNDNRVVSAKARHERKSSTVSWHSIQHFLLLKVAMTPSGLGYHNFEFSRYVWSYSLICSQTVDNQLSLN